MSIGQRMCDGISRLPNNPLPREIVIIGRNDDGKNYVQIFGVLGEDQTSRNCALVLGAKGRVSLELANSSKAGDQRTPCDVMMENNDVFAVGNGIQTNYPKKNGKNFQGYRWEEKPDNMPRIIGVTTIFLPGKLREELHIEKFGSDGDYYSGDYYFRDVEAGFGHRISTYSGNENPLLNEPIPKPLKGGIDEIAEEYWGELNDDGVAIAVKFISLMMGGPSMTKIINKYDRIG